MIYRRLDIARWRCEMYVSLDGYWVDEIVRSMVECQASQEVIDRIKGNMGRDEMDTGFTFSNPRLRRSVMVIGRTSEGRQFLNSFVHELRHLVDDIAETDGLEITGEGVAYLSGDIAMELADVVCTLSCDHCRMDH